MGKKKTSDLVSAAGVFQGLVTNIMAMVKEGVVPFDLIRKLSGEAGRATLHRALLLALEEDLGENVKCKFGKDDDYKEKLPFVTSYCMLVDRSPLPPKSKLEEIYSCVIYGDILDGNHEWQRHESRRAVDDVLGKDVAMVLKGFTVEEANEMGGLTSDNIIAWGLKNDLLPADEKENHALGIKLTTCNLDYAVWVVGLGSYVLSMDTSHVSVLSYDKGRCNIGVEWIGFHWFLDFYFLFVHKE